MPIDAAIRLNQATADHLIITQLDVCDQYSDHFGIYRYQLKTNKLEAITQCGRHPYAIELADKQFIAVQLNNGNTTLVKLNAKGEFKQTITHKDSNTRFGQLALSPNKKRLAVSTWHKQTGWGIEQYDLQTQQWLEPVNNPSAAFFPSYQSDNVLLSSANNTGTYNIYRNQKIISNVVVGASNPVAFNKQIFFTSYKNGLFFLTELQNTSQIIAPLTILNTEFIPKKAIPTTTTSEAESYSPIKTLAPFLWGPFIKFGTDLTEFGAFTMGSDVLDRHQYIAAIMLESSYLEPSAF